MPREMPPFSAYDPDVAKSLNWLLSFADPVEWRERLTPIDDKRFDPAHSLRKLRQVGYDHQTWPDNDPMGWYLYLALTALNRPFRYEPREGCRIIPILKHFGTHLTSLKAVKGVDQRIKRLLAPDTKQPDPILFELLVALHWKTNGFERVEFLAEAADGKTPDLIACNGVDEWFIECKRLDRYSQYTGKERAKWRSMWTLLSDRLADDGYSALLDIEFHVELRTLPDDYLATRLPGKLRLVQPPAHVVSDETMDVTAFPMPYAATNRHLDRYRVRCPSDQLDELLGDQRDPNRGFSAVVAGDFQDFDGATFLDRLSYAAAAHWHCDAPSAVLTKARHVRSRLAQAIDQLPNDGKGAVHIGLETADGAMVEEARHLRNHLNIFTFDPRGKNLRWICCHLFQFYSPPRDLWVLDETVSHFGTDHLQPLRSLGIFPSDDPAADHRVHWRRSPP